MKNAKTAHSIGKNRRLSSSRHSRAPLLMQRLRSGLRFPIGHAFRPFSAVLCLLSAAFLFSCLQPSPVREQLQRAEQMMETDSRAAALVLDSIDSSTLRGEEAALYALLKTQADYKSRIRLTSDSLPLIATGYYGTRRKTERAALSQYYLGCAYGDMHRDLDAIDALLRATTLFPDTTNKYFAYSLFELGKLYMNHHMEDEALEMFKRNRLSEACRTDSLNIGIVDYYMGLTASYIGDDVSADSLLHCVIHNTQLPKIYYTPSYHQLAKLYFYHYHDVEKASEYTDSLIHHNGKETGSIKLIKGDIHLAKQEASLAFDNYQKALANDIDIYTRCTAYKGLTKAASFLGMADSVQSYMDHYTTLLDSIYGISRQEEIAQIQESHVIELHDKELEARHRRFLLWMGLFAVVLLTGSFMTYLLADRRRKSEKLRYERALDAIRQRQVEQLAQEEEEVPDTAGYVEEPDEECDGLENQENSLFVTIQRERIALYRQQFAKSEWPAYFRLHRTDIKLEKKMDAKHSEELRRYLKTLFSELFVSMLGSNLELTKHDLEYCAMVMLGFNTTQMAYCTQASVHSYHCRHGKMKSVLSDEWYQIIFGKVKR